MLHTQAEVIERVTVIQPRRASIYISERSYLHDTGFTSNLEQCLKPIVNTLGNTVLMPIPY